MCVTLWVYNTRKFAIYTYHVKILVIIFESHYAPPTHRYTHNNNARTVCNYSRWNRYSKYCGILTHILLGVHIVCAGKRFAENCFTLAVENNNNYSSIVHAHYNNIAYKVYSIGKSFRLFFFFLRPSSLGPNAAQRRFLRKIISLPKFSRPCGAYNTET